MTARTFASSQVGHGMGQISTHDWALRTMNAIAARFTRGARAEAHPAAHLATGERGEQEALFYLRRLGYTVVATRWTTTKLRGDIDLVAWDRQWLCFIEVKTRSGRDAATAESAVDPGKQEMLRRMARAYLRRFPEKPRTGIDVRFDVVSVYLLPAGIECELYRGAFGW